MNSYVETPINNPLTMVTSDPDAEGFMLVIKPKTTKKAGTTPLGISPSNWSSKNRFRSHFSCRTLMVMHFDQCSK